MATAAVDPEMVDAECLFAVWPPKVESLDELDQVLAELGRLERLESTAQTELQAKIAELTAEVALVVELEGSDEPVSFADWRAKLEDAAKKFANKRREEILDEGRKSRELNHGKFGWKDSKAGLEPLADFESDGNPKILDGILVDIRKSMQKLADFVQGGARFVECKLSWRKTDLFKAFKDQDITLSVLKKAGFEPREVTEEFYLKPEAKKVESL
jgi:uncharacterized protein with ATP-grasp and redox domains